MVKLSKLEGEWYCVAKRKNIFIEGENEFKIIIKSNIIKQEYYEKGNNIFYSVEGFFGSRNNNSTVTFFIEDEIENGLEEIEDQIIDVYGENIKNTIFGMVVGNPTQLNILELYVDMIIINNDFIYLNYTNEDHNQLLLLSRIKRPCNCCVQKHLSRYNNLNFKILSSCCI